MQYSRYINRKQEVLTREEAMNCISNGNQIRVSDNGRIAFIGNSNLFFTVHAGTPLPYCFVNYPWEAIQLAEIFVRLTPEQIG